MKKELKRKLLAVKQLQVWQTLSICEQQLVLIFNLFCARLLSDLIAFSTQGEVDKSFKVAGIIGVSICSKALISYLFTQKFNNFSSTARHCIEMNTYALIGNVSIHKTKQKEGGTFFETINDDLNTIADYALKTIPLGIGSIICAFGYFGFLFFENYIIAITLLVLSLIQIVPPIIVKEILAKNYDDTRNLEAELTDEIISGYRGFEIIKLFNIANWEKQRLAEIHKRYIKVGNKSSLSLIVENAMMEFCGYVLKVGSYIAIGLFYIYGICSLDVAVSAIALMSNFNSAMRKIFVHIPKIRVADKAFERNNWLLDNDRNGDTVNNAKKREIILSNVGLSDGKDVIIHNVTSKINLDTNTFIDGKNGSGKTTVIELMQGIRIPTSGSIEYEGCSRNSFRYCRQDDLSLNMTIDELFSFLNEKSQREAYKSVKLLGVTSEHYGKRIRDLSGGTRKKVFLSLALAHNNSPVFLDEPTNHIDDQSVETLIEMIREHKGGLVIVSHDERVKNMAINTLKFKEGTTTNV